MRCRTVMRLLVGLVVLLGTVSTAHGLRVNPPDDVCRFDTSREVGIEWTADRHVVVLRGSADTQLSPADRMVVVVDHPSGRRVTTTAVPPDPNNAYGATYETDAELDSNTHYVVRVWHRGCPRDDERPNGEWVVRPEQPQRFACGTVTGLRDDDASTWRGQFAAAVLILGALMLCLRARQRLRALVP